MPDLYVIQDVDVTITYPDDTTETFTLESPNAESDPFVFGFRRVNLLSNFRAGDGSFERGWAKYQFVGRYNYISHRMNIWKLLIAENIRLKIPPNFDSKANYQEFDTFLESNEALRSWFDGLVMGKTDAETAEKANVVPSGGVELEFAGKKPFTEQEVRNIQWQPGVS